ncbi:BatD family protein [Symmachiella macrocystis]|uniref:BatD family protein n=1 Tax=Symmachiella macrocystis TaxID=2527985 RepID=UPI0018D42AB0|nr:BatD family protein [Symmachiella macrocystis]
MKLVYISAPAKKTWVGQRTTFYVELRSPGPFVGAAGFSLPQIPRCVIVKVSNPVVSSKVIEGETWFIQTHEFALFSQAAGDIELPSFEVRFTSRNDFDGPGIEHVEKVPAMRFTIQRPPDSADIGFLVTTDEMTVTETWQPQPGPSNRGAIFHRSITQTADQMTGMALSPPPTDVPSGIRVYIGKPEVTDKTERGAFSGMRRDTITYVLQQPGTWTLPTIKYIWWNPKSEQYGSKVLPAVTFQVAAAPHEETVKQAPDQNGRWGLGVLFVAALGGILFWQRAQLGKWARAFWNRLNPPEQMAARNLKHACRQHDPHAAEAAWLEWRLKQPTDFQPAPPLRDAAMDLQRHLYGPLPSTPWQGDAMGTAFRRQLATSPEQTASQRVDLPALNNVAD